MVKVGFDLRKKDFVWIGFIIVVVGLSFGYAFGGTNPAIEGHTVKEIDFSGGFSVPSGNVGIGVPVPTQKLDVNGNIKANSKIMASEYCDVNGNNCASSNGLGGTWPNGHYCIMANAACPSGFTPHTLSRDYAVPGNVGTPAQYAGSSYLTKIIYAQVHYNQAVITLKFCCK